MALKTYRGLTAWKHAMHLVEVVYRLTAMLPSDEKYGLTSQVRRAAVSIPSNIAEGYGRSHRGDYLHHLSFARGSLMELETLLTVAARLKLCPRQRALEAWRLCQNLGMILNKLINSLEDKPKR